jgi:hypothetical protein
MNIKLLKRLWKQHKFVLMGGLATLGLATVLLVSAVIWGASAAIKNLSAGSFFDWPQSVSQVGLSGIDSNSLAGLALTLTQQSLTDSLKSGDLTAVADGIACVNSIGGPTPKAIIDHLRLNLKDASVTSQLFEVEQALTHGIKGRTSGHCLNWLLNS